MLEARLTEQESAAWIPLISTVTWLPAALDTQLERDSGLGHGEFVVLKVLYLQEDHQMHLSKLARIANSRLSRLSKVVDRLAKQGWVERHRDPNDRRSTIAALTESGERKYETSSPGHVSRLRELVFDQLDEDEVRQLTAIMGKISTTLGLDSSCSA
ncbi:MarR family winged helix-turn-helix transcriptional regulator [Microbacterium aurum]